MSLVNSVLEGNRLALARLLTHIENDTPIGRDALNNLFPFTGNAHLIGITGAPGTGKSTLVNQLALNFRNRQDNKIGIVAIDPSSPFTGGAILGDRVRMRDLSGDPKIFIRSMASRGSLGGLASMTTGIVTALDAAGFDIIMIETVGAGQAEVDIAKLAHTTIVVDVPGLGDDIQAIKAGILEIADILVLNKADRPGVEITERALNSMLHLANPAPMLISHHGKVELVRTDEKLVSSYSEWKIVVHKTIATKGEGIDDLVGLICDHNDYLKNSGYLEQREYQRLQSELNSLLRETLVHRWRNNVSDEKYERVLCEILERKISPWSAVDILVDGVKI